LKSPRPLAVGVIGVGAIGWHHARHLAATPDASLVGVFDIRPERARFVAERVGTRVFPTRESLLREVQAVVVAASTAAHGEVGLAVIEAGLPLLMEKPLAGNLPEAASLVAAAEARGVLLQVGQVERFNRALRAAKPYLDRPLLIEGQRLAPFQQRGTDVPVVLDLMIHDLDLILHLTGGAEAEEVRAAGAAVLSPFLDVAHARVEFAGGAVASVTASRVAQERIRRLRIYQHDGCLDLDLAAGTGVFLRLRARWDPDRPDRAGGIAERIVLEAPAADALRLELTSFLQALRQEGTAVVSGREGVAAVHLAEQVTAAIHRSPLEPAQAK
jgi:predicted dehydrogenase